MSSRPAKYSTEWFQQNAARDAKRLGKLRAKEQVARMANHEPTAIENMCSAFGLQLCEDGVVRDARTGEVWNPNKPRIHL